MSRGYKQKIKIEEAKCLDDTASVSGASAKSSTNTHDVENQSSLVSMLLLGACDGSLSFNQAQKIAYAAYLDGLRNTEVELLASAGAWGENPSHTKRDITRKFFHNVQYAKPVALKTIGLNTKSNEVIPCSMSAFLPHELISSIFKYPEGHGF